jgi:transposase
MASSQNEPASPTARQAAELYRRGANLRQVASELSVGLRQARDLVAEGGASIFPGGHRPEGSRQQESVRAYFQHGTVRAAAQALGRGEQTVSRHLRQAGIVVKKGRPRTAGKPDQSQLLAAERSGDVDDSLLALGLNRRDIALRSHARPRSL